MKRPSHFAATAIAICALTLALLCMLAGDINAQMTPPPGPLSNWVQIEDSVWVSRIMGHDTLDPIDVTQGYVIEMLGDTTCATKYTWADCRVNSTAWRFYHWHGSKDRVVSTAANLLSWNTRTITRTVHTGDTITFFRHLQWYNPQNHAQRLDGYISRDTLAYTIELVRTSDSLCVAKLDSIGVMPSPTAGIPAVHGTRPILALATWVVPSSLDGQEVYLRLHLYDRGDGDYFFERYDRLRMAPRRALTDPEWINYLQSWGALGKGISTPQPKSPDAHLTVNVHGGQMEIAFSRDPSGRATGILISDLQGHPLFFPYLTPGGVGTGTVTYRPDVSGTYIVGLLHQGKLVASTKVIITK